MLPIAYIQVPVQQDPVITQLLARVDQLSVQFKEQSTEIKQLTARLEELESGTFFSKIYFIFLGI